MKRLLSLVAALCLALALAPAVYSQSYGDSGTNQLLQGTQLRLSLLTGLSSKVARDGDPFIAEVSEAVYLGNQLVLPAGTRVLGKIGTLERPKRFSLIRGQAYMNLSINAIEISGREIPVQMSLISLYDSWDPADNKNRKDLRIEEGVVVEAKRDIKRDLLVGSAATGGGTIVGAIFSHALRGFGIGLAGTAAYVVARKGKEVELPAKTGMLVRVDNTILLPASLAQSGNPYPSGTP